jgi:RHS repeat-associated protein
VLCRYLYDPLDRQTDCTLHQQPAIQRFNCKDQLATEIQGNARRSILQCDNRLLAQLNDLDAERSTTLLATDQQRSVLNALDANQPNPLAYSPYGHRPALNGLLSLLGFNGERPDPVTGHYHLGNGYRQFNPVLMRFNSPDSWSPFGEGGLNAYAYCKGNPVGRCDPSGHISIRAALFQSPMRMLRFAKPIKFGVSTASTFVGIAGLIVEATVLFDEGPNNALFVGSFILLGGGIGGMLRNRQALFPRSNFAQSRNIASTPQISGGGANLQRAPSIDLQNIRRRPIPLPSAVGGPSASTTQNFQQFTQVIPRAWIGNLHVSQSARRTPSDNPRRS